MSSRLNPYIIFNGNARQAMEFYQGVFDASLNLATFGASGVAPTPEFADQIMHGLLETPGGFTLMASDSPPGVAHTPGTNMSVSLSGDDVEALRGYWSALSEGGTITVPMEKQMWGDEFGACVDRFGVSWMVNISQPGS